MAGTWWITVLVMTSAGTIQAQTLRDPAVCKANQSGNVLVTTIEYDDGHRVQAPWRVIETRINDRTGTWLVKAVVDRMIEKGPGTRKQATTQLPGPVEVTFKGRNAEEILKDAAAIWCSSVAKAVAGRSPHTPSYAVNRRQMM